MTLGGLKTRYFSHLFTIESTIAGPKYYAIAIAHHKIITLKYTYTSVSIVTLLELSENIIRFPTNTKLDFQVSTILCVPFNYHCHVKKYNPTYKRGKKPTLGNRT